MCLFVMKDCLLQLAKTAMMACWFVLRRFSRARVRRAARTEHTMMLTFVAWKIVSPLLRFFWTVKQNYTSATLAGLRLVSQVWCSHLRFGPLNVMSLKVKAIGELSTESRGIDLFDFIWAHSLRRKP